MLTLKSTLGWPVHFHYQFHRFYRSLEREKLRCRCNMPRRTYFFLFFILVLVLTSYTRPPHWYSWLDVGTLELPFLPLRTFLT